MGFGMPGPMEMIIILGVLGVFALGVVVIVLVLAMSSTRRKRRDPPNPSLVNCPQCNHAISPAANTCPSCGHPLKPNS